MSSWNFPSNQDGQIKGVADAGIETFNGTEISSLARENCQNSLDAAADEENPNVVIDFERYYVPSSQIPGMSDYAQVLKDCQAFWNGSKSEKAKKFLRDAVSEANKEKNFVLRISDHNTVGLADPYGISDPNGFNFEGWNSLIKIDGGANKGDDKAGAFGIGKSAPFSNSYYRLVFYRTLNQAGEKAAQGVSRILSYPKDLSKPREDITTGVGYYGDAAKNDPVNSIAELDSLYDRTDIGTDVFVCGFKASSEWKNEIIAALLESFLMSIYQDHLTININDTKEKHTLNKATLAGFMTRVHNERPGEMKSTYGNYLALTRTDGVSTYTKDFHGLGTLELRILVDPNEKLDRKILVVRKAGMKLFRLGNISKIVPFTGILELKGKKLNNYFREMESVAHDNWEPGRHTNPKQAKAYYEEIKEWIRDIVAKLAEHSSDEEIEVQGLGGILQKQPEETKKGESENKKENLNDYLGNIEIITRAPSTSTKGFFYGKGDEGIRETEETPGTVGDEGDDAVRTLKGHRKRKSKIEHKGKIDPEGKDIIQRKLEGESNCSLKGVRIIKQGAGRYSIIFSVPHDVDQGRIELVTVGENGKSNKIRITGSSAVSGCASATLNGDSIEATNMKSADKVKINVTLADTRDYAMEVYVYEHK